VVRDSIVLSRAVAVALICVVLPVSSYIDGSGALSWSMYSHASSYRVRITAHDPNGSVREIAPTRVAESCSDGTATALAGADHFRGGGSVGALRANLDGLAEVVCATDAVAVSVEVVLEERPSDPSLPLRTTSVRRDCR
jgi:hypothetical protein